MKICRICGINKSLTEFGKDKSYKDGYNTQCKECRKIYTAQQREKHKDKINQKYREKYASDEEFREKRNQNSTK